jgi:hypothetical protein
MLKHNKIKLLIMVAKSSEYSSMWCTSISSYDMVGATLVDVY